MTEDFKKGDLVKLINEDRIGTIDFVSQILIYVNCAETIRLFLPHELRKITLVGPENDR